MKTLAVKNKNRVLSKLIDIPKNAAGYIYEPVGFRDMFPFVSEDALTVILSILDEEGLIKITYGNQPECFNIQDISITPKGYKYKINDEYVTHKERFHFWLPFVISVIALIKSFFPELVSLWKLITQS